MEWLRSAHPAFEKKSGDGGEKRSEEGKDEAGEEEEMAFNCVEQYMMFAKALFFHDEASGEKIMDTLDPAEQKSFGRNIKNVDDFLWRQVCERIAFEGNWWNFSQNKAFRDGDRRWGIRYQAHEAMKCRQFWGENLLGKALMRVRGD
ncbi:hypothetical protein B0J14DRAFT_605063 [Halenospora varia]|nr:hypothetical protein B0J14DRAFT_605063 [Halenospora varia]